MQKQTNNCYAKQWSFLQLTIVKSLYCWHFDNCQNENIAVSCQTEQSCLIFYDFNKCNYQN